MSRKATSKIFAVILCLAMILSSFTIGIDPVKGIYVSAGNVANAEVSSEDIIQEGTILQAFCWDFNTIKANMADIAAAGYTTVQTSPIQACLDTNPAMTIGGTGHWYYHYQPTDYTIGNYQLGTEAEFQAMCAEADKYGIKIIVDVVPNHTTTDLSQVSTNLMGAVGADADTFQSILYHAYGLENTAQYSDREKCTTYAIGNLPDINTENPDFQNYFINFLDQCIANGADGFRYDSAKHIGLSDDPMAPGVTDNNFWERVTTEITGAADIFNYGEVLQGGNDRLDGYVSEIGATTASTYGANIRTALVNNNFLVSNISGYAVSGYTNLVNPHNLVTWVESHDNYYNDGTWSQLDDSQVALGWAIIAARAEGTPLFFSRPQGSSTTNEYGTNTIGIAGDDNFKNPTVAAVNKFRNAMVGELENLTNPDGNAKVLMIERGSSGVVIVNGSSNSYPLDAATNLADGTYIDKVDDSSVFTVTNGEISGVLPARSAVVLYGAEATSSTTVHFYNEGKWTTVLANADGEDVQATNDGDGWWRATVPADAVSISFNDGTGGNQSQTFTVDNTQLYYTSDAAYASKAAAETALGIVKTAVHFFNSGSWNDVSAYIYGPGELFGGWPGKVAKSEGDGWWTVDVPSAPADNLHVIFNNNNNGKQSADFVISDSTNVYVTNENNKKYASKVDALTDIDMLPGTTAVYFYNNKGWSEVSAYVWGNAESLGSWPGTAATSVGDNWWKVTVPENPNMNLHIIFNNNNKGSQTGSIVISDITNRYTSAFNDDKYPSKQALLDANGVSNTETKVYFYNYDKWESVYAYATKGGDLLGAYPGTLATEGQNYWWSITIPSGTANDLQVTFNDGSEANQSDTFTVNDPVKVYYTGYDATEYSSKSAAETAMNVPLTKTTVYFYNNSGWDAVSAYLYGDCTNDSWPGQAASEVENGWWKYDIPTEASSNLHVIFNNDGKGSQSADFTINDSTHTYVTNFNDTKYTSIDEAEQANGVSHDATTVYFYNSGNWSSVYAYASNGGDEVLGAFPGTLATVDSGNWYKVEIPAGASSDLSVSFNDGSADNKSDTFTVSDTAHVFYSLAPANSGFVSKVGVEVTLGIAPTTSTLHFYNGGNWSSVTAYVYGPSELLGGWPGTAATNDGDGWWFITVPAPAYPSFHVIFNNAGAGSQSADYTIDDFTYVYVTNFSVDKYDSKVKILSSVVTPSAITGLANGTAKTAAALGLPSKVALTTDNGSVNADVTWDVNSCSYDPSSTAAQTFTVSGSITLPDGVINPNTVSLATTVSVTVNAKQTSSGGGAAPPAQTTNNSTSTVSNNGGITTVTFEVTPTVNGGTATAALSAETVNRAVQDAMSGTTQPGGQRVVAFDIKTQGQISEVALTIPGNAFSNVAKASTDALTISSSVATVTFDKKAIETISGAGNGDVTVNVAPVDVKTLSLSDEVKKMVGDRPVYDFNLMNGNQRVSNFNGGSAAVEIPYTLHDGENSNAVVVYYLDDSGKLQTTNAVYDPATKTVKVLLSHFSKYVVGYNKVSFVDVANNAWYAKCVDFVTARNLFAGVGDNKFAPNVTMTRAMFVQVIANLEGADLSKYNKSPYSDVDFNSWYGRAVAWASDKGIAQGGGNGKFSPEKEITREQMAVMLYNYMTYKGITLPVVDNTSFADSSRVSSWASSAVTTIHKCGIINGSGGLFAPKDVAQRASVAAMFMNFLNAWLR